MALVEVFSHVFGDDRGVPIEHADVAVAHLGGDFVADVEELPQMAIELGAVGIVAEDVLKLGGGPMVDFGGGG